MKGFSKIGFGGGCHWCSEAYFQHLKGVKKVEQGWISSEPPNDSFSEAVQVYFDEEEIPLETLIQVHLYTHSSTNEHKFRDKYRSAIYTSCESKEIIKQILDGIQKEFDEKIITQILPNIDFKLNDEQFQNYFEKNKNNGFCSRYINPKLLKIQEKFSKYYQGS
ncbi:MAG: peptide-methionine (S)-S-oxide reductase [Psychroserpens sp.]|nr:peptide-methionine (S)-S-oxide reductase [Psychroserpens sp.]